MTASKPTKNPYRYQVEWVSAEIDLDAAQRMFDLVMDYIEDDRGHVQGGFVGLMPAEDVVAKSPLYFDLMR